MIFSHSPFEKLNIQRIDSEYGRRYRTPEGNVYESATTWLGRIGDTTWLSEWKERVGEAEAEKITRRAAKRGTTLHENVENYLSNKGEPKNLNIIDKSLFKPFKVLLDKSVNNIRALEYPLYSDTLQLAGTVDIIADYNSELSIIDVKSAKARKNKENISSYFLQTAIYSYMIEERYKIKIDKLVIIIALDHEYKVQVFEESRANWRGLLVESLKKTKPIGTLYGN